MSSSSSVDSAAPRRFFSASGPRISARGVTSRGRIGSPSRRRRRAREPPARSAWTTLRTGRNFAWVARCVEPPTRDTDADDETRSEECLTFVRVSLRAGSLRVPPASARVCELLHSNDAPDPPAESLPDLSEQAALVTRAASLVRVAEPVEPGERPIHRPDAASVALPAPFARACGEGHRQVGEPRRGRRGFGVRARRRRYLVGTRGRPVRLREQSEERGAPGVRPALVAPEEALVRGPVDGVEARGERPLRPGRRDQHVPLVVRVTRLTPPAAHAPRPEQHLHHEPQVEHRLQHPALRQPVRRARRRLDEIGVRPAALLRRRPHERGDPVRGHEMTPASQRLRRGGVQAPERVRRRQGGKPERHLVFAVAARLVP
mmetsp:Transcript_8021/g.36367  ORF Transcript_8021/g.36367 Transcript_8021/m.36367 type:complete len:376 (-) Transcript_8021:293-1420(-)